MVTMSIPAEGQSSNVFSHWRRQLITKDDAPFHLHKLLGMTCLLSFMWRLTMISMSMGFDTYPQWTLPTVILHACLNLSSLVFKIPSKRIKSGDRVWPEYRLHALVFLGRSLALIMLYHVEMLYNLPPQYHWNYVIVILAMFGADVSSWSVGTHHSRTIRDLEVPASVRFFFSAMQFGATAASLYGVRKSCIPFNAVFIVQITPFLMTLRRRNLLSKNFVACIYGCGLFFSLSFCFFQYGSLAGHAMACQDVIFHLAILLRLGPKLPVVQVVQNNKYIMWTVLAGLLHHIRPIFDQSVLNAPTILLMNVLRCAVLVLFVWKGFLCDLRNSTNEANKAGNKKLE